MSILELDRIRVGAVADSKEDAIKQAGALLVAAGCVTSAYVDGMLQREQTMSTFLGSGVAIPHGTYDNRDDIHKTGIAVVQLPDGVDWGDGDTVHLVIGIAASSDEHIGVLSALAEAIEDDEITAAMRTTTDPSFILAQLTPETTTEA